jgi:hypothetical protein
MGILGGLKRKFWFECYDCMQNSGHDELKSVFYYEGPPTMIMGRAMTVCPRCQSTNTVSFQKLKDDGCEAQLWGLEQTVKKHPRSTFEVKSGSMKS